MDEATKRRWDVRLGIVTPILTVIGILIGIWKFTAEQANQTALEYKLLARENSIEFERKLWQQQLDTYARIADIAGRIATEAENAEGLPKLVKEFLSLYWGIMVLVEDNTVESTMIAFRQEVDDFQNGWSNAGRVKKRALRLVEACRVSSNTTWKAIEVLRGDAD